MDKEGFERFLRKRDLPQDFIENVIAQVEQFEKYLTGKGKSIEKVTEEDIRDYHLWRDKTNKKGEYSDSLWFYFRYTGDYVLQEAVIQFFETRSWLSKFSDSLEILGEKKKKAIMQGNEEILMSLSPQERAHWTREAMNRLDASIDEEKRKEIMFCCSHVYPEQVTRKLREEYQKSKDIDRLLRMLHNILVKRLEESPEDFDASLEGRPDIVHRFLQSVQNDHSWGAGIRKGSVIYITKVPYCARGYYDAENEKERRFYYCHCPMVREAIKSGLEISPTFCYCGGGFYKPLWEGILGKKVDIEVIQSVLQKDSCCRIAVYLPFLMD